MEGGGNFKKRKKRLTGGKTTEVVVKKLKKNTKVGKNGLIRKKTPEIETPKKKKALNKKQIPHSVRRKKFANSINNLFFSISFILGFFLLFWRLGRAILYCGILGLVDLGPLHNSQFIVAFCRKHIVDECLVFIVV